MVVIIGYTALGTYWDIRWQAYVVDILDRKMKIRIVKRIMKQGHCCSKKNLSFHWMILYWVVRWNRLNAQTWNIEPELKGKIDHRITKAISLTRKSK